MFEKYYRETYPSTEAKKVALEVDMFHREIKPSWPFREDATKYLMFDGREIEW